MADLDPRYDHAQHEEQIYALWEQSGGFNPDNNGSAGRPPFTIIMPPPNANDPLHVGHAAFLSIEDILIRHHRMLGEDVLWLPGTDHAGIETQFVFEKKLQKKGQSRFDFDRDTLYHLIWDYVQENSGIAVEQMKKIGASADWSRFMFMLDPQVVEIVINTFIDLQKKGLIYRSERLVNYCTKCGTAFSELEVEHIDQTTKLYFVRYPFVDQEFDPNDPSTYLVLATTRPEPIFADTHLAVHPDNPKTKHLIGRQVHNPLTNQVMTIIADEFVDPEFGTGIVKLTPAHDPNDFEVAQRHHLPIVSAITTRGKIADSGGKYAGLSVNVAREQVVADLDSAQLLDHVNDKYQNRVGTCYRCKRVLEPLPLPQFFISVKPLAKAVLLNLDSGQVAVHGAGHDKILRHWLENLKDWNISRQIVWGIRLPVWYNTTANPDLVVSFLNQHQEKITSTIAQALESYSLTEITQGLQTLTAPNQATYEISSTPPGPDYIQETDTFDTWFSSGQWPFSTLQALDAKQAKPSVLATTNYERFYPTTVMETGYDILPFWVMRMLMLGLNQTNQLPFSTVYLHGLVRDQQGQKMSKSKGNVINPLDVIGEFGADALRLALVIRSSAGLDKSVGHPDFKAARNLTNKLWNAARFVQLLAQSDNTNFEDETKKQLTKDIEFREKLDLTVVQITQQLTDYKIGFAAETAYNEFWHWFCDEAIEQAKRGEISPKTLSHGLTVWLKLLHPFIPFVTEALWQQLATIRTDQHPILMTAAWPTS